MFVPVIPHYISGVFSVYRQYIYILPYWIYEPDNDGYGLTGLEKACCNSIVTVWIDLQRLGMEIWSTEPDG